MKNVLLRNNSPVNYADEYRKPNGLRLSLGDIKLYADHSALTRPTYKNNATNSRDQWIKDIPRQIGTVFDSHYDEISEFLFSNTFPEGQYKNFDIPNYAIMPIKKMSQRNIPECCGLFLQQGILSAPTEYTRSLFQSDILVSGTYVHNIIQSVHTKDSKSYTIKYSSWYQFNSFSIDVGNFDYFALEINSEIIINNEKFKMFKNSLNNDEPDFELFDSNDSLYVHYFLNANIIPAANKKLLEIISEFDANTLARSVDIFNVRNFLLKLKEFSSGKKNEVYSKLLQFLSYLEKERKCTGANIGFIIASALLISVFIQESFFGSNKKPPTTFRKINAAILSSLRDTIKHNIRLSNIMTGNLELRLIKMLDLFNQNPNYNNICQKFLIYEFDGGNYPIDNARLYQITSDKCLQESIYSFIYKYISINSKLVSREELLAVHFSIR